MVEGSFAKANGTTGNEPSDLRNNAKASSARLLDAASTWTRLFSVSIHTAVCWFLVNARGNKFITTSSFNVCFSVFFNLRFSFCSRLSMRSSNSRFTTFAGNIFSSFFATNKMCLPTEKCNNSLSFNGFIQPNLLWSCEPQGWNSQSDNWRCNSLRSQSRGLVSLYDIKFLNHIVTLPS